jgi:sugar phosphate isomerase/epimerase
VPFCQDDIGSPIVEKRKIKVAIQLVSLIPGCKEDLAGTLRAVAQMGYKGVEFASNFGGFYGKTPVDIKKLLDECGLACAGWHPATSEFEQNALPKTIDTAHELGVKYLIQAQLAVKREEIDKRESWLKAADRFNAINKVCLSKGLAAGYQTFFG